MRGRTLDHFEDDDGLLESARWFGFAGVGLRIRQFAKSVSHWNVKLHSWLLIFPTNTLT